MPFLKRRGIARRTPRDELRDRVKIKLLSGCDFSFLDDDKNTPLEMDELAESWADFREELLHDHINGWWCKSTESQNSGEPGTRPWGWWEFDAPERRRCLNQVHPFENPGRHAHIAECIERLKIPPHYPYGKDEFRLWFGKPGSLYCDSDFSARFESETDYLDRLGLLTDSERAALETLSQKDN